jgi:hypothetical protein
MNEKYDDKFDKAAAGLRKGIRPQHDLWPGIEAAIAQNQSSAGRRSRWSPMLAQAAAVVLLVGATSGLTYLLVKNDTPVAPVEFEVSRVFDQAAYGEDYQIAREGLVIELDQKLERLSPEAQEEVRNNLDVIRKAIRDISIALEDNPNNPLLQQLLLDTYRDELRVMYQVNGLTRNVVSRNDI